MVKDVEIAEDLIEKLVKWFKTVETPVIIAFSGGVDSSVVLAIACSALGYENVIAATAFSPIRFVEDLDWAKKITSMLNVKHVIIETNEMSIQEFLSNPPDRCYICKKHLAEKLLEVAKKFNAKTVVDGTNASDLKEYRPGVKAFKEVGVRSPLAELGIGKEKVKIIAKTINLPNWDRPSATCLVTRIPYGEPITMDKLERIAKAEEIVKRITGVRIVRVRDHNYIARIEVDPKERSKFFNEEVMNIVALELKKLGYKYVTLDLLGYRSGSLDELIK